MLARFALAFAVLAISILVLVVPVVRMRLRHGITGVAVHRAATPVQRTLGVALGLFFACLAGFSVARAILPGEALGLWSVPRWVSLGGWSLLSLGVLIIAVAQAQMGPSWRIGIDDARTDLVVSGLYRWSRNPIYAGMGLAIFATIAVAPSAITLVLALQGAVLLSLETRLEEQHLATAHGQAFEAYAARVGRFLPLLGRLPMRPIP